MPPEQDVAPAVAPAAVAPVAPAVVIDPATAPAPVPIALPIEAPAPAPVADPAVPSIETAAITYEPTGDVGLDIALAFVGRLGIAQDHPAMEATANGDFSLIEAHLAAMGDKAPGWEQHVALAKQSYEKTAQTAADTAGKVEAAVTQVAGGAEQWAALQAWAATNATPEEKAEINAMFDSGPTGARAAATLIRDAHAAAVGTTVKPKTPTRDASRGASTTPTNGPLDARAYGTAVRELRQTMGNRMEQSPEYAALRARLTS
jgi:hypothetical protein